VTAILTDTPQFLNVKRIAPYSKKLKIDDRGYLVIVAGIDVGMKLVKGMATARGAGAFIGSLLPAISNCIAQKELLDQMRRTFRILL
jgi:hypothetical protein